MPIGDCYAQTGKAPIKVRWVITNKGNRQKPDYRARLVTKEIKTDQRLHLFAATPPLEAKKFLSSLAVVPHSYQRPIAEAPTHRHQAGILS